MSQSLPGAVLLSAAFLVAACEPSPPIEAADGYLRATTAFCGEVAAYATTYEDWDLAGGAWPEWQSEATALVEALEGWESTRPGPDTLPADLGASIDHYSDSFVERLRGSENVRALRANCDEVMAGLEQYVATLR